MLKIYHPPPPHAEVTLRYGSPFWLLFALSARARHPSYTRSYTWCIQPLFPQPPGPHPIPTQSLYRTPSVSTVLLNLYEPCTVTLPNLDRLSPTQFQGLHTLIVSYAPNFAALQACFIPTSPKVQAPRLHIYNNTG